MHETKGNHKIIKEKLQSGVNFVFLHGLELMIVLVIGCLAPHVSPPLAH